MWLRSCGQRAAVLARVAPAPGVLRARIDCVTPSVTGGSRTRHWHPPHPEKIQSHLKSAARRTGASSLRFARVTRRARSKFPLDHRHFPKKDRLDRFFPQVSGRPDDVVIGGHVPRVSILPWMGSLETASAIGVGGPRRAGEAHTWGLRFTVERPEHPFVGFETDLRVHPTTGSCRGHEFRAHGRRMGSAHRVDRCSRGRARSRKAGGAFWRKLQGVRRTWVSISTPTPRR